MATHRTSSRWTYSEFMRLPSGGSERHEVIAGELFVTPAPTSRHQGVVGRLMRLLGGFVEEYALGEVLPGPIDVLFAEGDYLEPAPDAPRFTAGSFLPAGGEAGPP